MLTSVLLTACAGSGEETGGSPSTRASEGPPPSPRSAGAPADAPQSSADAPSTAEVALSPEPAASSLVAATPLRDLGCERVWPEGLGVAGGRAYWAVQCTKTYPRPDEHLVLSVPLVGGDVQVVAASPARLSVSTGALVVVRHEDGQPLGVLAGGEATPFPTAMPDSADCTATATDASNVYCLGGTEATRTLKAWKMVGSDPSTVTGAGPTTFAVGATATEIAIDDGAVVVAEFGTYLPHTGKGAPTHRRDGRIVRIDVTTGSQTVLAEGIAPFGLAARQGTIAWHDMFDPERSVLVRSAAGQLLDTTSAEFTPEWGFRDVAIDVDASGTTLWAASRDARADVVLAPDVRVRYVVDPAEMPRFVTASPSDVYWLTSAGVFRRPK